MKRDNYTEDSIEELIKQLPDVSSSVPKEQFIKSVMMKVNQEQAPKKKSIRFVYSLASVAMVAIIGAFSLNLLLDTPTDSAKQLDTAMQPERISDYSLGSAAKDSIANNEIVPNNNIVTNFETKNYHSLVLYKDDLPSTETFITYQIVDESVQYMIPMTLAVPVESGLNELDLFLKYQESFDETNYGLWDTYPLPHRLSLIDNELYIDVDKEYPQGLGTAGESQFFAIANYFSEEFHFDKVKFTTDGNPGIEFSHIGTPIYEMGKNESQAQAFYLYYPNENQSGSPLLAKPFGYNLTLDEAFEMMYRNDEYNRIYSAFPEQLAFDYTINKNVLEINFTSGIEQLKDDNYRYTIDCILAVAKSAGFSGVQFNGLGDLSIGSYNFKQVISVPDAYNLINRN